MLLSLGFILAKIQSMAPAIEASNQLDSRGEIYFRFVPRQPKDIRLSSKIVSLDKFDEKYAYAYANRQEFARFLNLNIPYEILKAPGTLFQKQLKSLTTGLFSSYPSHGDYIQFMEECARQHPAICSLQTIGTSVKGRKIHCLKISDKVKIDENEPEIFYSSTMHGDEPLGMILLMRLADSLLNAYPGNGEIKSLVEGLEIWINPLANPDGAYFTGDESMEGATRYNANHRDLNRDFPTLHGDTCCWEDLEPEVQAMVEFMKERDFVLSANFHGGAAVVNYPWDTWERLHPDDEWFQYISSRYAGLARQQALEDGEEYMKRLWMSNGEGLVYKDVNGTVNGYAWYTVTGSRQDFVTYFLRGREVTIELSEEKIPPESDLLKYWRWNAPSLLDMLDQAKNGLTGFVKDSLTGNALEAKVYITNHDTDRSESFANNEGWYKRFLSAGEWNVSFNHPGYFTKTVKGVQIQEESLYPLNVSLSPEHKRSTNLAFSNVQENIRVYPGHKNLPVEWTVAENTKMQICLYDITGKKIKTLAAGWLHTGTNEFLFSLQNMKPGLYILHFSGNRDFFSKKFFIN